MEIQANNKITPKYQYHQLKNNTQGGKPQIQACEMYADKSLLESAHKEKPRPREKHVYTHVSM